MGRWDTGSEKEWYLERKGLSLEKLLGEFEAVCGVRLTGKDVSGLEERKYREKSEMIREIVVVGEIVRRHEGKLPMAVVSSSTRGMVETTLEELKLRKYFAEVVTVEDVAHAKPAPDGFLEAARRLGVEPKKCLVFEDSEQGMEAGRRAGMRVQDVRGL